MSHFALISTVLKDEICLKKALEDLNYNYESGNLSITGFGGKKMKVDLAVRLNSNFDIGFKRNEDGNFDIVADWYGIEIPRQRFVEQITQQYAYNKVLQEVEEKGLIVAEKETLKDGTLKLVVRGW